MCIHALGEEDGKKITPHVHCVTLATGIMAQPDGDEATAQALVRHTTVDALRSARTTSVYQKKATLCRTSAAAIPHHVLGG